MQRTWTTALIAAAAMAMPVGLATSAEAKTQDRCTIKPLLPKFVGHYPSGYKKVDYRISVQCNKGRKVLIQQRRYEQDNGPFGQDDFTGASSWNRSYLSAGTSGDIIHSYARLPNDADGHDGKSEVYHKVRFRVSSGGVQGQWTSWEKSGVRVMPY